MPIVAGVLTLLLALEQGHAADLGALRVRGLPSPLHCVSDEWQRRFVSVSESGSRLTFTGGGGLQLATTPTAGAGEPSGYFQWKLLGQTLSYTVDLSNVGCSCNAALYFAPGWGAGCSEKVEFTCFKAQWCCQVDGAEPFPICGCGEKALRDPNGLVGCGLPCCRCRACSSPRRLRRRLSATHV